MSVEWNYFKRYKIEPEKEYSFEDVIEYIDGDTLGLGYRTSANLRILLSFFGASIPVYHWGEPPKSKKLELIEPFIVVDACIKALKLLDEKENPMIDEELLFEENELKDEIMTYKDSTIIIPSKKKSIIEHLEAIKELSEKGYYFVEERGY